MTAGRTRAQKAVALRESRRRGIDPPGITSADATLLAYSNVVAPSFASDWSLQFTIKFLFPK